ncbi:O-antigen ligase family protein [Psychroserpens sp.]|uniref:O-antigen ligase family protein n=1 Tax=Psychroserpens sp. TaxID=2020870 RepID=UPI00385C3974
MILIPFIIFLALIITKIQKGLFACLLVVVATKSIIDAFWDYQFGPLSVMSIQGVLITVLFYTVLLKKKQIPQIWMRTANIYILALSFGIIWAVITKPMNFVENTILSVNIYLGFILIPLLVNSQKRLKQLLLAIMICGLFPILVSIYQLKTGVVFRERETVGLIRYVGFYHDAFPVRFYGLMSLFSVLIYQVIFKTKDVFLNGFMLLIAGGAFLSIYAAYSKAAIAILGLWIMFLLLFSESKVKQSFSILVGLLLLFIVFGDAVSSNIEQLFSKEVGYQTGEVKDAKYTLAGRGYIWEDYWKFWLNEQTFFHQWFGDGLDRAAHNEFLRILLVNGIVGVILLAIFMIRSISNVFKVYKNIRVFAFMLFSMYLVDCIGLVPGKYYYYNILVWGIFGILLLRPQLFIKQQNN